MVAKRAGLRRVSLHTLRHSHGSQLLSAGVPLPTVNRRLGHSNAAVTAQIYSHPFTRDEIAAGEVWDGCLLTLITSNHPMSLVIR